MKKKLVIIGILIPLLLLPIMGISGANDVNGGTASWTGVKEKEYIWKQTTANNDTLQKMHTDLNLSKKGNYRTLFSLMNMTQYQLNVDVLNITTNFESSTMYPDNVTKVDVNTSLIIGGYPQGEGSESMELANLSKPGNLYTRFNTVPFTHGGFVQLIRLSSAHGTLVSTNVNWTYVVQNYTDSLVNEYGLTYGDNFTISKSGNGFHLWYNNYALNQIYPNDAFEYHVNQTKSIDFTMRYNDNGILSLLEVKYGAMVASAWEITGKGGSIAPVINILSPSLDREFGTDAPEFSVEISDPNLDSMWYRIEGGEPHIFSSNGTLDQEEWNSLENGTITITFYANDTAGNLDSQEVQVTKGKTKEDISDGGETITGFGLVALLGVSTLIGTGLIYIVKRKLG